MSRLLWLVLPCCTLLAACNDSTQVSQSGFGAFEPSLAVIDGGLAAAWNDNRSGNDEIYLRLLADDLAPVSEELRLTNSPGLSYEAALANFNGNLALAWYDRAPDGRLVTNLGLWTPQGEPLWQRAVSAPERSGRVPVLQTVGERLFIAWVEDALPDAQDTVPSSVRGAWLDADGAWLVPPFEIAQASRTTWNLNVDALPDGRILLVFDAEFVTHSSELYLALLAEARAIVVPLDEDDGFASKYPDIAVGAGKIALTWFDMKDGNEEVYLALFEAPLRKGVLANPSRITNTAGESIGAYLAWNGATLGLAWNDDATGQHEIYFQAFTADGTPLADERRLTDSEPASMIPAIVPWRDSFALAWNEVVLAEGGHDGAMSETRSEIIVRTVE